MLEDCCLGYDEGTHRFAVEHILPMQGTVTTSSALLAALELDAVDFTRTVSGPVPA